MLMVTLAYAASAFKEINMTPRTYHSRPQRFPIVPALSIAAICLLGACAADEPVGTTETTTKKVIDTPTEKTTITETHKKDTKLYPH